MLGDEQDGNVQPVDCSEGKDMARFAVQWVFRRIGVPVRISIADDAFVPAGSPSALFLVWVDRSAT